MLRDILYAPDYVINAGGIIKVAYGKNHDDEKITRHVGGIHDTLSEIFSRADAERLPTNIVADHMANERLVQLPG